MSQNYAKLKGECRVVVALFIKRWRMFMKALNSESSARSVVGFVTLPLPLCCSLFVWHGDDCSMGIFHCVVIRSVIMTFFHRLFWRTI